MNGPARSLKHQRGAVAVIVGISIAVLIMMVGLVVDLGFLYTRKTELQNAADAAALAGAKELNSTAAGINAAAAKAIELAAANSVDFGGNAISISNNEIEFGPGPDGPWSSLAGAQSQPGDMKFIKVDTSGILQGSHPTWFMRVSGFDSTTTYGLAVAGRYTLDIAPIGVCAVDKTRPEYGFIRGVAYNIPELNPLVIQADPMFINPVNAPPDSCADVDPQWNSRDKMAPFLCTGTSAAIRSLPGQVFVNTGVQAASGKEINSRFDDFQGSKCSVATAPPDSNVREYPASGLPRDWMQPGGNTLPSQQGITIINRQPVAKTIAGAVRPNTASPGDYGVLWSHAWERNFFAGSNHNLNDWPGLYGLAADQTVNGYPGSPATPHPSPYAQESGKYFRAPPSNPPGMAGRRILNLVLIDCSVPEVTQLGPGNKCAALPTLAIGEFFMPVASDLPKKELYLEFSRMVAPPLPLADIRLYR